MASSLVGRVQVHQVRLASTHFRNIPSIPPPTRRAVSARTAKSDRDDKAKDFAFRYDHAGECDLSDARDVRSPLRF